MEVSGRLDMRYLEQTMPRLKPGRVYELMCHPGVLDKREVHDRHLLRYHDWEGELRVLTGSVLRRLLERYAVRLIGYRHVEVVNDELVAKPEVA